MIYSMLNLKIIESCARIVGNLYLNENLIVRDSELYSCMCICNADVYRCIRVSIRESTRLQSVTFVVWRSWYVGQVAGVTNKWLDSNRFMKRHTLLVFVAPNFQLFTNFILLFLDPIYRYRIIALHKSNCRDCFVFSSTIA